MGYCSSCGEILSAGRCIKCGNTEAVNPVTQEEVLEPQVPTEGRRHQGLRGREAAARLRRRGDVGAGRRAAGEREHVRGRAVTSILYTVLREISTGYLTLSYL